MAYDEPLAGRVRDYLAPLGLPTEEKRMMGGLCFMVHAKMCVGVHQDQLMLRLDPPRHPGGNGPPGLHGDDDYGSPASKFCRRRP